MELSTTYTPCITADSIGGGTSRAKSSVGIGRAVFASLQGCRSTGNEAGKEEEDTKTHFG